MSELSIAELASENAELLPRRETLSTIVIKSASIAFANNHSIAVSIDKVNIVGRIITTPCLQCDPGGDRVSRGPR